MLHIVLKKIKWVKHCIEKFALAHKKTPNHLGITQLSD